MKFNNLNTGEWIPPDVTGKKWLTGGVVSLVLLVFLTYSGAVKNNFVGWDDSEYVVDNELVRSKENPDLTKIFTTAVSLNYHPLTILSLNLNNNTCKECPDGISPRPFIISNIVIHVLNTILVFFFIYMLFRKNLLLAFVVAAIFGVHPMHVESVAWISGRKDVLSSFFFLSGLLSWIMYAKGGKSKYICLLLTFILFILACLSKATAIVFPAVIVLINYFIINDEEKSSPGKTLLRAFSPSLISTLLPFFAVSVFLGLMALHIQSGKNFMGMLQFIEDPDDVVNIVAPFSLLQRLQIGCYGFFVYIFKFLVPVNQSAFYPYPSLAEMSQGGFSVLMWFCLLAFIVTVLLVIFSMKKTRIFMFCFGFYLVALIMVLQFISVGKAILAERYTYLPYIGLAVLPAYYLSGRSFRLKRILILILFLFMVIMILLARNQVKVWHDTGSLWTQVIKRHPDLELARRARGKYYYLLSSRTSNPKEKNILEDKAIADFNIAIREKTVSPEVYEGMGMILQARNEFKTALQLLDVAVKLNPENGRTYYNRAIIFDQMNQKEEAINDYKSALALSPEMALEILRNRSVLYIETGRYENAVKDLDELIRIDGKEFTHYYNRAFSKLMIKDIDGAIADYNDVLKLNPEDQVTKEHLRILMESKKTK